MWGVTPAMDLQDEQYLYHTGDIAKEQDQGKTIVNVFPPALYEKAGEKPKAAAATSTNNKKKTKPKKTPPTLAPFEGYGLSSSPAFTAPSKDEPLNVLLVHNGDPRHILKTMSFAKRWPNRQLNFYIMEPDLHVAARDLLLLAVFLETRFSMEVHMNLWMELFSNNFLRSAQPPTLRPSLLFLPAFFQAWLAFPPCPLCLGICVFCLGCV